MASHNFVKDIFDVDISEAKLESVSHTCDMQDIDFVSGKSSDSASPTDTLFITMKDPFGNPFKLFMKSFVYIKNESSDDNPLVWETYYYYMVTSKIYKTLICRNVLPMITFSEKCNVPQFETFLTKNIKGHRSVERVQETSASFTRNLKYMVNEEEGRPSMSDPTGPLARSTQKGLDVINGIGLIITHQVSNDLKDLPFCPGFQRTIPEGPIFTMFECVVAMFKSLDRERSQEASQNIHLSFVKYVFQVMFALHSLSDVLHFNQNDLHLGNILMDRRYPGESVVHRYVLPRRNIDTFVQTNAVPRIFDFDRSTSRDKPNDTLEAFYTSIGQSKEFSPLRDVVKVLGAIHKIIRLYRHIPAVEDIGITIALLTMPDVPDGVHLSFSGYSARAKNTVDRYLKDTFGEYKNNDFFEIRIAGRKESVLTQDHLLSKFAAKTETIVYRFMRLLNSRPEQVKLAKDHADQKDMFPYHTSGDTNPPMPSPPRSAVEPTIHHPHPVAPAPIVPRPLPRHPVSPAPIVRDPPPRHRVSPVPIARRPLPRIAPAPVARTSPMLADALVARPQSRKSPRVARREAPAPNLGHQMARPLPMRRRVAPILPHPVQPRSPPARRVGSLVPPSEESPVVDMMDQDSMPPGWRMDVDTPRK